MLQRSILAICLVTVASFLSVCLAEEFFVAPPSTIDDCPSPCHTLDQYASNSSLLDGYSNISLVFMSGVHYLNQSLYLSGTNIEFRGQSVDPEDTTISFQQQSSIQFSDRVNLQMSNVQLGNGNGDDELISWDIILTLDAVNVIVRYVGIHVQYAESVNFVSCVFTDGAYLMVAVENNVSIYDCLINRSSSTHLPWYLAYGLRIDQAHYVSINNSNFTHNSGSGLVINNTDSVSIEGSMLNDNAICGLYVCNAYSVVIKDSMFNNNAYGHGLYVCNAYSVVIKDSMFNDNAYGHGLNLFQAINTLIENSKFNNNSHGLFNLYGSQVSDESVEIKNSNFTDNNFLGIWLEQVYNVSIEDSTFSDNNVGGLQIKATIVSVENSHFFNNKINELGVFILRTKSARIQNVTVLGPMRFGLVLYFVENVTVTGSHVMNAQIGICSINSALTIHDTTMNNNDLGVVIGDFELRHFRRDVVDNTDTLISASIFTSHKAAALVLINPPKNTVTTQNSSFIENQGTPVLVYQSTITLEGENIFRDNTAERGGGLALFNSTVVFSPESNTSFINNTAREFGGAVYISTLGILIPQLFVAVENIQEENIAYLLQNENFLKLSCFYHSSNTSRVTFTGNTAVQGGYDIYGPTLYNDDCLVSNNQAFTFDKTIPTFQVSSDPSRVCFCENSTSQCEDHNLVLNEMRYPGETSKVSVTLAGYDYGRVAGLVYANVLGQDYTKVLGDSQHIQDVNLTECAELEYTVFSNSSKEIFLSLTARERFTQESTKEEIDTAIMDTNSTRCREETFPCTALLTTPIYIRVTLRECPLGFQLNNERRRCECDSNLANINSTTLTCDIHDRMAYINREGRVWVGEDTRENTTDVYYWHENCPSDYCNPGLVNVTLTNPDVQCSLNRSGMLCGGCQDNHSLMLGGNKCSNECSNHSITWILVFAVFGVLLVVFIKVLDLTVANGTINGLIFYANVVWANRAILFSLQDRLSIGYYIITVPIAWLNLDFGIEICFSQSLDQLTKTGLQFVFPVYIWCIAGLIILVSHYSAKATKLFGSNSVAVLATLFLLSYGKLVRNITDVFNFADIMNSNSSARKVWSLDGNVTYRTGGHIALIIFAIIFLILLLLFTSTLLLVPLLRGMSDRRPLHWINTLKPFFDTFYGPFKDKKQHHLWTGILLISRVIILIVFAATSTINPDANILLLTMNSMLLLMYSASVGLLYKKWTVSFLENSYILNLMFLGAAFLFITISGQGNSELNPVTATSVCIALFQFTCILIGHLVKQVLSIGKVQAHIVTRRERQREIEGDNNDLVVTPADRQEGVTYQVVEIPKRDYELDGEKYNIQYREELFDTINV